ncbi:MAG: hypothetical protein RQ833_07510 [Sphingomonadaceae bacterium]|nr:hypothetical protein [Sphingomonadaceae bacterium]
MKAFDLLPPGVRRALWNVPCDLDAPEVLTASYFMSSAALIASIIRESRTLVRKSAADG